MAKETKDGSKKLVSRRDFLMAGGAVIAAGALSACTPKTETVTSTITGAGTTKTVTNHTYNCARNNQNGDKYSIGNNCHNNSTRDDQNSYSHSFSSTNDIKTSGIRPARYSACDNRNTTGKTS